jgi:hypothetical protein
MNGLRNPRQLNRGQLNFKNGQFQKLLKDDGISQDDITDAWMPHSPVPMPVDGADSGDKYPNSLTDVLATAL